MIKQKNKEYYVNAIYYKVWPERERGGRENIANSANSELAHSLTCSVAYV